jgi:hypothetical protein
VVGTFRDHFFEPNLEPDIATTFSLASPFLKAFSDLPLGRDIVINHLSHIAGNLQPGDGSRGCASQDSYFIREELRVLQFRADFLLQQLTEFMAEQASGRARLAYRTNNPAQLKSKILVQSRDQLLLSFVCHVIPPAYVDTPLTKPNIIS